MRKILWKHGLESLAMAAALAVFMTGFFVYRNGFDALLSDVYLHRVQSLAKYFLMTLAGAFVGLSAEDVIGWVIKRKDRDDDSADVF